MSDDTPSTKFPFLPRYQGEMFRWQNGVGDIRFGDLPKVPQTDPDFRAGIATGFVVMGRAKCLTFGWDHTKNLNDGRAVKVYMTKDKKYTIILKI